MAEKEIFDIAVIGAGPAGLAVGLACAQSGLRTAIVGPPSNPHDGRTSALFGGSIDLLKMLGVWPELSAMSEPIVGIRIVDAGDGLVRAPELLFEAREAGLSSFGYNIPNAALTKALEAVCTSSPSRIVSSATDFNLGPDHIALSTEAGPVTARLVVAADGRASTAREAAGIEVSAWTYPQSAIVTTFSHGRPHGNVSTELHRRTGPLTVVPGPRQTSNLVWIDSPEEVARLLTLDDSGFARELGAELKGLLGTLANLAPRQAFPLTGQTARSLAKNRTVVVGEAAHVIPPIGAQGLNLSFRDAAALAEIAAEAKHGGLDIGGDAILAQYNRMRKADVGTRVFAVDMLNRSLLSNIPGVALARGFGLFALASSPFLRARVMREGIMPVMARPSLTGPLLAGKCGEPA